MSLVLNVSIITTLPDKHAAKAKLSQITTTKSSEEQNNVHNCSNCQKQNNFNKPAMSTLIQDGVIELLMQKTNHLGKHLNT